MPRRTPATALVLVALFAVACTSAGSGGSSSAAAQGLPGSSWTVKTIAGAATETTTPPTIAFGTDGTITGTTGCNNYNGSYKLDGSAITIGPLAMTMMACPGPVGAQETAFAAALPKSTGWSVGSDGNLTLTGAVGIVAAPKAKY